jgi:hypothetical protein
MKTLAGENNVRRYNQSGNGGMNNDPISKGQELPTDSSSMSISSPVAMGPVKKVDQGREGDVCKSSLDQIANANPLTNRFKNTEGRGA